MIDEMIFELQLLNQQVLDKEKDLCNWKRDRALLLAELKHGNGNPVETNDLISIGEQVKRVAERELKNLKVRFAFLNQRLTDKIKVAK